MSCDDDRTPSGRARAASPPPDLRRYGAGGVAPNFGNVLVWTVPHREEPDPRPGTEHRDTPAGCDVSRQRGRTAAAAPLTAGARIVTTSARSRTGRGLVSHAREAHHGTPQSGRGAKDDGKKGERRYAWRPSGTFSGDHALCTVRAPITTPGHMARRRGRAPSPYRGLAGPRGSSRGSRQGPAEGSGEGREGGPGGGSQIPRRGVCEKGATSM